MSILINNAADEEISRLKKRVNHENPGDVHDQ
jgi:hypothetical protein